MSLIQREQYLDFLRRHKDQDVIKVVSGVRRCGKSTLFELFKQELLDSGVKPNQIDLHVLLSYHQQLFPFWK